MPYMPLPYAPGSSLDQTKKGLLLIYVIKLAILYHEILLYLTCL
jgi:hypothetical protein